MSSLVPETIQQFRCPHCALPIQAPRHITVGRAAVCPRCGLHLFHEQVRTIDVGIALTLAALILFLIANLAPFMTFAYEGRQESNHIVTGIVNLYARGFIWLASLICFTSVVAPLVHMLGLLYVLVPLRLGRTPWRLGPTFRILHRLRKWAMLEVYLLGVIVAVVKLGQLATIEPGLGSYAFVALIFIWTAGAARVDARVVWEWIEPQREVVPTHQRERYIDCEDCFQLCLLPAHTDGAGFACSRCGSHLHRRKPDTIKRTWALLIAAALLYIPANYFPVLKITILGKSESDTILSGVRELMASGMWGIGALVFFASITVPMLKLIGLTCLLVTAQRRSNRHLRDRAILYRVVEYIGRWSMIDMFMVSILVALVQLGSVATINPGIGAPCFAGVVVLTMLAASAFDPRVTWDRGGQNS